MISITALEKSINSLKKNLENKGFDVDVDVFKGGRGGDYYVGSVSYVEIDVNKGSDFIGTYRFLANDYAAESSRHYGGHSIKQMKAEFIKDFDKDCN